MPSWWSVDPSLVAVCGVFISSPGPVAEGVQGISGFRMIQPKTSVPVAKKDPRCHDAWGPWVQGHFSSALSLSTLLDSISMGLALLDHPRRPLHINQSLEILTRFHRHEVQGLPRDEALRPSTCLSGCQPVVCGTIEILSIPDIEKNHGH